MGYYTSGSNNQYGSNGKYSMNYKQNGIVTLNALICPSIFVFLGGNMDFIMKARERNFAREATIIEDELIKNFGVKLD